MLAIHREYRTAAALADQRYYDTMDGPISQRLATLSLTRASFGRFCETTDTVHNLVAIMAKARVEKQSLAWGRGEAEEKAHLSVETGFLRRQLSGAAVTSFGQRLASRMSQVGGQAGGQGAQLAALRRQQWGREEEAARRMREGNWLERTSARDCVRRGRFWMK